MKDARPKVVAAATCLLAASMPACAQNQPNASAAAPVGEPGVTYHVEHHAPHTFHAKPPSAETNLIMSTTDAIDGCKVVSYKGLVEGVAVREPTGIQDLAAEMQGMFGGGNVDAYGQMCEQGRVQAYNNLMQRARNLGANAVIGIHFDSEPMSIDKEHSATAVVCYGTAVVVEASK